MNKMATELNCSECGAFIDDESDGTLCLDCLAGMDAMYWDKHEIYEGFQITESP